jgi:hypothetical protein
LPRAASERTVHSPGNESITDSVLPPIDPVEPSMQILLGIQIHFGLRIADFGLKKAGPPGFNPQSEIRNPKLN